MQSHQKGRLRLHFGRRGRIGDLAARARLLHDPAPGLITVPNEPLMV
jgi:hypothetical protein